MDNPWFSGQAQIATFSPEEVLATKLRALLQRDKSRDLLDLSHALGALDGIRPEKIVDLFRRYLENDGLTITRAHAEERIYAKLSSPTFLADSGPLLSPEFGQLVTREASNKAAVKVLTQLVARLPGKPWANSKEMQAMLGLSD